jgi:hypothetical protein
MLDRNFWQALGKARGWAEKGQFYWPNPKFVEGWVFHWHRFIDHLSEGKDAESFFISL